MKGPQANGTCFLNAGISSQVYVESTSSPRIAPSNPSLQPNLGFFGFQLYSLLTYHEEVTDLISSFPIYHI